MMSRLFLTALIGEVSDSSIYRLKIPLKRSWPRFRKKPISTPSRCTILTVERRSTAIEKPAEELHNKRQEKTLS